MERFVALQPNPASERVQVVSNVGLNHVEVYNTAGVKVMDLPASGLSLTLNIDALPEDTYLPGPCSHPRRQCHQETGSKSSVD